MVSSAGSGPGVAKLPFVLTLLAAFAATVFAVGLHHYSRGRIAVAIEHRPLDAASMQAEQGFCYKAALGVDWLSSDRRPSPARLLEDGRELGPANAQHEAIRRQGGGAFSIWHGQIYFSTSDGGDPRANGRRYEVVWPTPVAPALRHSVTAAAVLLWLLVVWLGRRLLPTWNAWLRGAVATRTVQLGAWAADGRRAWLVAGAIGVLAIVVRAVDYALLQCDLAGHISGGLVMGVPFSDAQGWDNQGASIMGGHGLVGMWSARRPFFAFVLGVLYTWTGPSAFAVVVMHMIAGGLTAALVCRIGQRCLHPAVGALAGIAFAFDPVSIEYSSFVLSETLGTLLFVVSMHQLVAAVQENRAAAAWWGGVAFVLSNLTRTLTLPAMPLLALVLLWRGSRDGRGWRRGVWLALLFSLGFALPLGAWIVRQKLVHDLTTISDNTASGLYAAASPKYGTWSSYVDREAEEAGIEKAIKPRYDWFMQRFRAELAADPWVYVHNVTASAVEAMRGLGDTTHLTRALLVVLLLGAWLARLPWFDGMSGRAFVWTLATGLAIFAVCASGGVVTACFGLLGLLLAVLLRRDRSMSLVLCGYVGTVVAVALFALGSDHRLLLMISWMQPLGLGALALAGMNGLARRMAAAPRDSAGLAPAAVWVPRGQRGAMYVLLVFVAGNLAWLGYRNYAHPDPMLPPLPRPTLAAAQQLVDRFAELRPDLIRADERQPEGWYVHSTTVAEQALHHGGFVVANARVSRHRYPIGAEVRVRHWSRMFAPRDYDRLCTYAETALPTGPRGPACIVLTEPLPSADQRDMVLLGRANVDLSFPIEECYLEVLAWAPIDLDGTFDLQQLHVTAVPAHARYVDALRK